MDFSRRMYCDERYLQYQVNNNLQYKCATCRGESYQVNSTDNASTRKAKMCDAEAELARSIANCERLLQAEKEYNQSLCTLEPKQDRVKDPESQLTSLQEISPLLDPGAVFDQMIARLLQMKADCYHGKGLLVEGPKVPTGRVLHCLDMPFQFLPANLKNPLSNLTTRSNQDWRLV